MDFPALLYLSSSSGISLADMTAVFAEVGANSLRIAVTTDDGTTQCYVEVETWDLANLKAWLWVKVPSVSSVVDTVLYLYYDNAQPDNTTYVGVPNSTPAENVWDANFCYDKETEVLTDKGWRLFSNLDKTELIATLNPETQQLEYQKPTNYIQYHYRGQMFKVADSNLVDLLVIPDHNMYVAKRIGDCSWGNYELLPAKNIFNKNVRYKKDAKWNGQEKEIFVLPQVTNTYYLSNQYQRNIAQFTKDLPKIEIKMDDWVAFFGYFISEGCATYEPNKYKTSQYVVNISQSETANPEIRGKIEDCLKKLPFKYSKSANAFIIHNKQLASYLRQFGKAYEKYIPVEFKNLSSRQLRILFNALMDGDGSKANPTYFTKSKKLADDVQEILLKIGGAGTIHYSNNRKYPIYTVKVHLPSKFSQLQPYLSYKAWAGRTSHNEYAEYDDMVYCVEVSNHIIYVRRNGKTVWCGNCLVSHMKDDPDTSHIRDSTSNNNDGTKTGTNKPVETASGQINNAQSFYGSDDVITVTKEFNLLLHTLSFWVNPASDTVNGSILFWNYGGDNYWIRVNHTLKMFAVYSSRWTSKGYHYSNALFATYAGTMVNIAVTWDGANIILYVNGLVDKIIPNTYTGLYYFLDSATNDIGNGYGLDGNGCKGIIDEPRFSNIVRSSAWMLADYYSQTDNLITYGTLPGGLAGFFWKILTKNV